MSSGENGVEIYELSQILAHPPSDQLTQVLSGPSTSSSVNHPVASSSFETKSYPDATYHNHYHLGISCCYEPPRASKPVPGSVSQPSTELLLSQVDIFNPPPSSAGGVRKRKQAWDGYSPPRLPLVIRFSSPTISFLVPDNPTQSDPTVTASQTRQTPSESNPPRVQTLERPTVFVVDKGTKARDFVRCLGEPSRTGNGTAFTPTWLEWKRVDIVSDSGKEASVGIQVELMDPALAAGGEGDGGHKQQVMGGVWDRAAEWIWSDIKIFEATP